MTVAYNEAAEITGPTFPLSGTTYVPVINEMKDGRSFAHAYQTILASPEQLYQFWHAERSYPLWQEHVVSVTPVREKVTHWIVGNPEDAKGTRIEFDSEITEDVPGKIIAWRSITEGVDQSGQVTFTPHPAGRGTIVLLQQQVKVPGGALGNAAASAVKRGPKQTVIENLRHFKEMVEAGAIPSVKGQPHGPRGLSGAAKELLYGENNPTPPGTSEQAMSENTSATKEAV